jgi:hypothetical protein
VHSTGLSPAHFGGHTRLRVDVVAEALSRSRPAGDADRYVATTQDIELAMHGSEGG